VEILVKNLLDVADKSNGDLLKQILPTQISQIVAFDNKFCPKL
jgi:hypothetical protein